MLKKLTLCVIASTLFAAGCQHRLSKPEAMDALAPVGSTSPSEVESPSTNPELSLPDGPLTKAPDIKGPEISSDDRPDLFPAPHFDGQDQPLKPTKEETPNASSTVEKIRAAFSKLPSVEGPEKALTPKKSDKFSEIALTQFQQPLPDQAFASEVPIRSGSSGNAIPASVRDMKIPEPANTRDENYVDLSIEDAVRMGLQNSKVIRDLGGTTLRNPEALSSAFDPSIVYSDPIFGEDAALSAFDAQVSSQIFFEKNDRELNNQFLGTNGLIKQDLGTMNFDVSKRTASGTLLAVRSISDYDFNNSVGNRFGNPSASWQTMVEGELRQPLLRGGRVLANRIAGPNALTGEFNGILLARTRTNISVSDFKISVRNLVSDIENAYWDLYFAYRDLEAKKMARDNALQSWRRIKALGNQGKIGGEADKEGQAREQYFRFEAAVQDAIYGRPGDGSRTNNGSTPGTFRPVTGVRVAERRLRFLIGLPIEDGKTIRPGDEPIVAPLAYDRMASLDEALQNRSELKRQTQRIRQVKLQMIAAQNMLLPQLDIIGRYRFRGFGNNLVGNSGIPNDSAFDDMMDAEHQEWQAGMELNIPIGFRKEYAATRNIRHRLMREQQIFQEQKRQVATDLGNAIDNVSRAYQFHALQYNRLIGAIDQLNAVIVTNEQKKAPLNLVLEAQRRVLDAQTQLYRAQVEFVLARRNVEFEKGTLLESMNVNFATDTNLRSESSEFFSFGQ